MAEQQITGATDPQYNLISVLYHATHGAWNYDQYISDAESQGDNELATFFREVQEEDRKRAERGKQLLASRVG